MCCGLAYMFRPWISAILRKLRELPDSGRESRQKHVCNVIASKMNIIKLDFCILLNIGLRSVHLLLLPLLMLIVVT
jgi:hypothetical protein